MTIHTLETTDGRRDRALERTYENLDEAEEALRIVMGWAEIHTDLANAIDNDREAICCYETAAEEQADPDGAHAPRIVLRTVSQRQIDRVRDEAGRAGDLAMVALCDAAERGEFAGELAVARALDAADRAERAAWADDAD